MITISLKEYYRIDHKGEWSLMEHKQLGDTVARILVNNRTYIGAFTMDSIEVSLEYLVPEDFIQVCDEIHYLPFAPLDKHFLTENGEKILYSTGRECRFGNVWLQEYYSYEENRSYYGN